MRGLKSQDIFLLFGPVPCPLSFIVRMLVTPNEMETKDLVFTILADVFMLYEFEWIAAMYFGLL
jgi:hypothetical protein